VSDLGNKSATTADVIAACFRLALVIAAVPLVVVAALFVVGTVVTITHVSATGWLVLLVLAGAAIRGMMWLVDRVRRA
jgi:hypothetical protein